MTEKSTLKERIRQGYWSIAAAISSLTLSIQPTLGETGDAVGGNDIWSRFSAIMKDVYGEIVGISTIVAVTAAAVALVIRRFPEINVQ